MTALSEAYLEDVLENQGKLFDFIAHNYPDSDTADFIEAYMNSKTRKSIDEGQAYTATLDYPDLLDYFLKTEGYQLKPGKSLQGFMPDWIGEFYAYYQWSSGLSSREILKKVPISFLQKAYYGLHDLDLELAVRKVGI